MRISVKRFGIVFFFTIIVCTGFNYVCFSQLPPTYNYFTIVNGLPDNKITAIAQDRYGYIWVGTGNGLARFDGKYFTVFSSSKTLMQLPSPEIKAILNLDSNQLAIVTSRGLNIIDVTRMKSFNLIVPRGDNKHEGPVNNLLDVLIDDGGNIYIISRSGLYHYNKEKKLVFRHDEFVTENAVGGESFGGNSFWLNEYTIIVTGRKGFYSYDTRKQQMTTFKGGDNSFVFSTLAKKNNNYLDHFILPVDKGKAIVLDYKSDSLIYFDETRKIISRAKVDVAKVSDLFTWRSKLYVVNDSCFYISGKFKGLYTLKLQPNTGNLILDTTAIFADKKSNALFVDRHQKIWLGFSDGLLHQKTSAINLLIKNPAIQNVQTGKVGSPLLQVAVTNKYVYGASMAGAGLHRFNKTSLAFDKTIPFVFPPFGNKSLFALEKWTEDRILCGTDAGLYVYNEERNKAHYVDMPGWDFTKNFVVDFFTDRDNNVWITTNQPGGCYIWKNGTPAPVWFSTNSLGEKKLTNIFHIAADSTGNVWLAGNGLIRYNINKKLIDISIQNFAEEKTEISSFDAIAVDRNGGVWLANGYGPACLVLFEPSTKKARLFTVNDGLPDYKAISLTYHGGYIWVVSKNGISKINCDTKKIEVITSIKDVYYQQFFSSSLVYDHTLGCFFTSAGPSILRFKAVNNTYRNKSPVFLLEYVSNRNDSTTWFPNNKINVSWNNRDITLFYNAINFEDPEFQKYAYRIIRNNKTEEWVNQEDQRRIVLTDLKPGKTIIEIKVFSSQNAWSEKIIRYYINVTPPFWKTNWFLVLCLATLAGILYSLYKYREAQVKQMAAIRENISKDLHDEIGATLSGIGMYSHLVKKHLDKNEVTAAANSVNIIQCAAAAMVTQLNDIIWVIKSTNESLEAIINRLEIFSMELCAAKNMSTFFESDEASKKCKPRLEVRKNIYLLCKEAINNSVKYSGAAQLSIQFKLVVNQLEIIIEDDGKGFDAAAVKRGNGLDNMQQRAADIKGHLTINTAPTSGCRLQLNVNITP